MLNLPSMLHNHSLPFDFIHEEDLTRPLAYHPEPCGHFPLASEKSKKQRAPQTKWSQPGLLFDAQILGTDTLCLVLKEKGDDRCRRCFLSHGRWCRRNARCLLVSNSSRLFLPLT